MKYDQTPYQERIALQYSQRAAHPKEGGCRRCGLPWTVVSKKTIYYEKNAGIAMLCLQCWDELETAEDRLPYHELLVTIWLLESSVGNVRSLTELIRLAVLQASS